MIRIMKQFRRFFLLGSLFVFSGVAGAQSRDLDWRVSLYGTGAAKESLPFWAVANKEGLMPDTYGGLVNAGTDFRYCSRKGFEVYSGLELTGYMVPVRVSDVYVAPIVKGYEASPLPKAGSAWSGQVNQLYAGVGWKFLRLDVGMRNRPYDYEGLSLTGGDIVWSGNVRAMPGYNFQVDWLEVPGTHGIWSVKANWSDYMPLDKRYVQHPLIHNKSLLFRFRLSERVRLTLGLEHFAIWSGTSPVHGR